MPALTVEEREALDGVEPQLARRGYRLIRLPEPAALPDFLRQVSPDAVALGGPPNLLIEVLVKTDLEHTGVDPARFERIREAIAGRPDWSLELIYARRSAPELRTTTAEQIARRSDEVRRLAEKEPAGALVLAWGLLEAVVRALAPATASRALGPGPLIELAVSMGYLEEADADRLRATGRLRNAIAHGDLHASSPSAEEIDGLLRLVARLSKDLVARESAPV